MDQFLPGQSPQLLEVHLAEVVRALLHSLHDLEQPLLQHLQLVAVHLLLALAHELLLGRLAAHFLPA
mgnify:FL=1